MRCCVPLCDISSETLVSKSREVFKPKAVTFHGFPTAARLKDIWLTNLGIDKNKLPHGAVVCSQHFTNDHFYFTKANFRKLRYDAIPLEVVPQEAQFCMICLDTSCTLYPLRRHNLHLAYSNLTGISTVDKLKNVLKLCNECAQRLINYCKLEEKSMRARNLMMQLVRKHGQLTTQNVRAINRVENKLTSDLVLQINEPFYFGPYIEESDVKDDELKLFENEYLNLKNEIPDHNYIKLDDELDSDADYEIERLSANEEMYEDDIKMIRKIVDDDEVKSCKVKKSTSSYDITNNVETNNYKLNSDSDEFESKYDIKTDNVVILDDELDSDVDYEIERLSENEEMYDDDIKMISKIVDDDKDKSRKVLVYTSSYGLTNDVIDDDFNGDYDDEFVNMSGDDTNTNNNIVDDDGFISRKMKRSNSNYDISNYVKADSDDFEVEYLNNYFGENIEYLKEDVEHVALALGAEDIIERNKKPAKRTINVKHSNIVKHAKKQVYRKTEETEKCDLKIFQITQLTQEEAVAEITKRKDQKAYIKSTYKCTECYKGYCNKEAFDSHMERHTDKFGPLTCDVCKTHKWYAKQLKHHQRNFHTLKYSCTLCPFVKTNKATAIMHERWHRGLKYECPHCSVKFIKHSTYMNHLRTKHPSDAICPQCGFSFVGDEGLETHMTEVHSYFDPAKGLDGPLCELCDIRFASVAAYRQHLDVAPEHADDGINDSDDAYRRKQIKRYRKIICEECGDQVVGFRRYYRHLVLHGKTSSKYRGETAMCEQCGKLFQSHTLLRYHMPLHSGQRQFPCEVCGKKFMLRKNLWLHTRIHKENRPRYECELCGKHFANQMGRSRHKRIVHESVKFECDLCSKKFTTAFARKNHVIHVHEKVPWPKRAWRRRSATARPQPQARRDTTSDTDTQ